jgi:hypothetical protein
MRRHRGQTSHHGNAVRQLKQLDHPAVNLTRRFLESTAKKISVHTAPSTRQDSHGAANAGANSRLSPPVVKLAFLNDHLISFVSRTAGVAGQSGTRYRLPGSRVGTIGTELLETDFELARCHALGIFRSLDELVDRNVGSTPPIHDLQADHTFSDIAVTLGKQRMRH